MDEVLLGGNDYVLNAVEDTMTAIRFLRKNAEYARIDPDRILLLGTDSGAIMSLTLAYNAEIFMEALAATEEYSSVPNAVVSMSGALK